MGSDVPLPLDADQLVADAARECGCAPAGDSWRPGLDRFLADFNRSATVNGTGRAVAQAWIRESLAARFAIDAWHARHPGLAEAPVRAPVFILGLPRAGTTMLLNLLALDPRHRVYWNWEANRELPPARRETMQSDPRIARKVAEVEAALASGALDERQHVERGDEPGECVWLLGQDFKSYPWLVLTAAPGYLQWLLREADMVAAYRHHRRALQVMQAQAPGQWLLKYPAHALFIDELLAVYPDARLVVTHRDPVMPLASSCSASHFLTRQFNDGFDPAETGRTTLRIIERTLDNICELPRRHPGVPVHHLHYRRLAADTPGELRRLYRFLGEPLDAVTEAALALGLQQHLQRREATGPNRYALADYGLSADALPPVFAAYRRQFDIEPEGLTH